MADLQSTGSVPVPQEDFSSAPDGPPDSSMSDDDAVLRMATFYAAVTPRFRWLHDMRQFASRLRQTARVFERLYARMEADIEPVLEVRARALRDARRRTRAWKRKTHVVPRPSREAAANAAASVTSHAASPASGTAADGVAASSVSSAARPDTPPEAKTRT